MTHGKKADGEKAGKDSRTGKGGEAPALGSDVRAKPVPEPAAESEEAAAEAKAEAEDAAARLEAEIATLKDQLLRALAETENVRRRAQREREDTAKYAISDFARDLLSVADNLRRALDSIPEDARRNDQALENLAAGVELTRKELDRALERHGVRRIEPLGEPFDHNLHQAMFEVETADHPPGTVAQLMQAGYVLHGRLLRPALVGVAKAPADREAPGGESPEAESPEAETDKPKDPVPRVDTTV